MNILIQNSYYTPQELDALGLKSFGENVLISRYARFYNNKSIEIGNNVRIDDFCLLSGEIKLGSFIHISAYSALYGRYGIEIDDYSGISPRCTIFSASDDFSGDFLIGPMINKEYTNITKGKVTISKYCQLGCNCIVMPAVKISEGVAIGAFSFVNKDLDPWKIYMGIPVKFFKERSKNMLNFT